MTDQTPTPRVQAIRRAAVRFAGYYGPFSTNLNGDEQAAHQIAAVLVKTLREEGLTIMETRKVEP